MHLTSIEVCTRKVGCSHIRVVEQRPTQLRLAKIRAPQISLSKIRIACFDISKARTRQVSSNEFGSLHNCGYERGFFCPVRVEVRAREIGPSDICSRQIGTPQVGVDKL